MSCALKTIGNTCSVVILLLAAAFGLNGCSDVSKAPAPAPAPAGPAALTITSTSPLPSGSLNIPYSTTLAATGGNPGYTWSLAAGSPALPNGLNLSPAGVISGTPSTIQTATPKFRVIDSSTPTPEAAEMDLTISINAVPQPSISNPPSLPSGVVGTAYNAILTATGGTPPYTTWTVNPPLPSPLIFTPAGSTATISGTPTATSNGVTHTFNVTDSFSPTPQTGTRNYTLTITAAPLPLVISTNSPLPGGTVTQAYGPIQLAATGGTPPLTWDLNPGSPALPNGLQLSSGGVLSGTPSTAVNVSPVFRVRDSATSPQQTATKTLAISIVLPGPPNITTTSLPNGNFNQNYNQTLQLSGGTVPFFWSFNGQLPPGLGLNSSTGVISGTANQTGTFNFTPQVVDATLQTDSTPPALSITIVAPPPPTITTSSLPTGTVNVAYPNTTLQATGGAPPLTFQPVGMPFGLSFDAPTATISGIPLSSGGPTNVTFTVNDSTAPFNQTGTRTLSLTVNAALTIGTASPLSPSGTVGNPYGPLQLLASGGTPPYSWSITGTGAPSTAAPGLTLSSAGVISGTPTTAGPFARTYRVQDNNAVVVTKSLTLNVNAALAIDTTSPLPNGKFGDDYGSVTPNAPVILSASGGTPPYTWSTTVTPALPDGLTIDAGGRISGTPKAIEANVFHTFTVTDSAGTPATVSTPALSLTIAP